MKEGPVDIARLLNHFTGTDLSATLARIEADAQEMASADCPQFLERASAGRKALVAAAKLKQLASQVDVTIHALGILLCLPRILHADETVEYVSLGAGNTGRLFDLETNLRIAEFKFIRWRGGPEAARQNTTFKDFYQLEAHPTSKRKHLYLLGTTHARKFFKGGRALKSVMSRDLKLGRTFFERFGERFQTVGDYYAVYRRKIEIEDMSPWVPELAGT